MPLTASNDYCINQPMGGTVLIVILYMIFNWRLHKTLEEKFRNVSEHVLKTK